MSNRELSIEELSYVKAITQLRLNDFTITRNEVCLCIDTLTELVKVLYEKKVELNDLESDIEKLVHKLIFASYSILHLGDGYDIRFKNRSIAVRDFSSIYILLRSVIENYCTLSYLFFNAIPDDERMLRVMIWRYSALKGKSEYKISSNDSTLIKQKELIVQQSRLLFDDISSMPNFKKLNRSVRENVKIGRKPRLKSWRNIIEQSRLNSKQFESQYSFLSDYSHSEYNSAMQLRVLKIGKNDTVNKGNVQNSLNTIQMVVCITIIQLVERFDEIRDEYYKKENSTLNIIERWDAIGRGNYKT
jgi:hypothetical protein